MKKALLLFLSLLTIFGSLALSCKRGENDPAFSLRTRKSRITGEWQVKKAEFQYTDSLVLVENNRWKVFKDGQVISDVEIKWDFDINRDGSYLVLQERTIPSNPGSGVGQNLILKKRETGLWSFVGGASDELPKGAQLLLLPEIIETSNSFAGSNIIAQKVEGPSEGLVYKIDELRANKVVLIVDSKITNNLGTNEFYQIIELERR